MVFESRSATEAVTGVCVTSLLSATAERPSPRGLRVSNRRSPEPRRARLSQLPGSGAPHRDGCETPSASDPSRARRLDPDRMPSPTYRGDARPDATNGVPDVSDYGQPDRPRTPNVSGTGELHLRTERRGQVPCRSADGHCGAGGRLRRPAQQGGTRPLAPQRTRPQRTPP